MYKLDIFYYTLQYVGTCNQKYTLFKRKMNELIYNTVNRLSFQESFLDNSKLTQRCLLTRKNIPSAYFTIAYCLLTIFGSIPTHFSCGTYYLKFIVQIILQVFQEIVFYTTTLTEFILLRIVNV